MLRPRKIEPPIGLKQLKRVTGHALTRSSLVQCAPSGISLGDVPGGSEESSDAVVDGHNVGDDVGVAVERPQQAGGGACDHAHWAVHVVHPAGEGLAVSRHH